jgi:hypothetical protein
LKILKIKRGELSHLPTFLAMEQLNQPAHEQMNNWREVMKPFRSAKAMVDAHEAMINSRGVHRDRAWYTAIAEACPNYLGAEFPHSSWPTGRSSWPTGPRTRKGTLTEVEATHWPESFRDLIVGKDPRLPKAVLKCQPPRPPKSKRARRRERARGRRR